VALGLNLCVYVPRTLEDEEDEESTGRVSNAAAAVTASSPVSSGSVYRALMPSSPTQSGLRMSKSGSRSSKV